MSTTTLRLIKIHRHKAFIISQLPDTVSKNWFPHEILK